MKSAQWAEGAEASSSGLPCPPRASRPQGRSSGGGSRGSREPAASLSTPSGQGCPGEELRVTGRGAWTRLSTAVHSGPGGARWAAEGTEATGSGAESAGHCLLSETSEAGSRRPLPSTATKPAGCSGRFCRAGPLGHGVSKLITEFRKIRRGSWLGEARSFAFNASYVWPLSGARDRGGGGCRQLQREPQTLRFPCPASRRRLPYRQ